MKAWTAVGQKLCDGWEGKRESFFEFAKEEVKKYALQPSEIGNMDKVLISFDMPTSCLADFVDVKPIPIITAGNDRNSFTMVLSCLFFGYNWPLMVAFKRKTIAKEIFPKRIIVLTN